MVCSAREQGVLERRAEGIELRSGHQAVRREVGAGMKRRVVKHVSSERATALDELPWPSVATTSRDAHDRA